MKITCETCSETVSSLADWFGHLPGESHQRNSNKRAITEILASPGSTNTVTLRVPSFLIWKTEANERAIVVTAFKEFVNHPVELMNHFKPFGVIADFIFDSEKHYAIILFDEMLSIEKIQQTKWSNVLKSHRIRLRRKTHISAIEWIILIELDGRYEKEDQQFFIHHAELLSSVANLHISQQLPSFIELTSLGPDDVTARQTILRDVAFIIRQAYPKVYVFPLQPLVKGFRDVDEVFEIYVDPFSVCGAAMTPPLIPDYKLPEFQAAVLRILFVIQNQTVLPGFEKYCSEVTVIPEDALFDTSERIIRGINFFHRGSGIRCNISFDTVMSANLSSLISFLMNIDVRVLPFIRFLHYWSRIHRFSHKNSDILPAITMLGIVYLSRKNIIPSIYVLQQLSRNVPTNEMPGIPTQRCPYFVEGWDVSFLKDLGQVEAYLMTRGKIPFQEEALPETNLHDLLNPNPSVSLGGFGTRSVMILLCEFFEAFVITDWSKYVVSPFVGELLPKEMFHEGREASLPMCLNLYRLRSGTKRLDVSSPLSIQHPFDLAYNMGEKLDEMFVMELKKAFQESGGLIKKLLSSSNPKLLHIFPQIQTLLGKKDAAVEVERELTDSENSNDSGLPIESSENPAKNAITYSCIAKKAALLPNAEREQKRISQTSSSIVSARSASTRDPSSPTIKIMKFEVNRRFREAFLTSCLGLASEPKLKDRLKTIAIVFMRDFVWSIWGRCFYLHATSSKILDTDQKFHEINKMFSEHFPASQLGKTPDCSDSSMSDIPDDASWQTDVQENFDEIDTDGDGMDDTCEDLDSDEENIESEPRKDINHVESNKPRNELRKYEEKKYHAISKLSPPTSDKTVKLSEKEKVDQIKIKLDKIPKSACKNYCQVMRLHGYQKIWSNRRGVRSALALHERLSKQLLLKEGQGTSSIVDAGTATLNNPLEKEEAVTRGVLEGVNGWGKSPSKRAIWSFSSIVRIDTTKDLPTLYMSLKEGRNPFVCQNMINYFGNHLPSLFSEYLAYRLTKWLDGYGSVPPASPQTQK